MPMLKTNTRYVVKVGEKESIFTINNEADAKYWSERSAMRPEWVFKEVIIHQRKEECESCSA